MRRDQAQLPRPFPTRLQLLIGFSVLVALFLAVLAVGVGRLLSDSIRDAALSGAEQTGRVFAQLEVGDEEYERGRLTPGARKDIGAAVETSSALRGATVWSRDHAPVYAQEPRTIDRSARPSAAWRSAASGEIASEVSGTNAPPDRAPGSREPVLSIYVPISLPGDRQPRNVLELNLPYAPVQAEIDRRVESLALGLVAGTLLFFGALLPSLLRGSRALADLYCARQKPLQRRLRRAMRDRELTLVYQPKLDLHSDEVVGVEGLLRWRLPCGRKVPPGEFIPLVESTAVMEPLTQHVFGLAARQSAEWARDGLELDVAINISACNLNDELLADRLARQAWAHGLDPGGFTLELTESGVSKAPDRDLETLTALRACGFKLSVDDFGTGESSLSRIDLVDFHEVKIDRSFVQALDARRDHVLVACIIELARALGARVVAEGVESEASARRLTELGCDALQGFHLAHPLAPLDLVAWLADPAAGARRGRADPTPVA